MFSKKMIFFLLIILSFFIGQYIFISSESKKAINEAITETTQSSNLTVTKLFINDVYPGISNILQLEENPNPKNGLEGKELEKVDNIIRSFMFGTDILKIKLYSKNGMTIYSTEASQIGDDKSKNSGFLLALKGKAGSQITHRGKFSAIEGEVFNKDLVSSYLPIKSKNDIIIGVAEIYTDRTPSILKANSDQNDISIYLLLFNVVISIFIFFSFWSLINKKEN